METAHLIAGKKISQEQRTGHNRGEYEYVGPAIRYTYLSNRLIGSWW